MNDVKVVMDTSAIAKWFLIEEESGECREIRDLHIKNELKIYTCDFALVELANVLKFTPGLSSENIVNAIKSIKAIEINLTSLNEIIEDAIRYAFKLNLTIYDALYVALSEKLNAPLITYDKELQMRFKQRAVKASTFLINYRRGR
ncbi:MAG: type II toxin-antitoxin system VapC family toxin [archaeon GB-1867-035]|nr:type II toxin-antitoxin system VapC family toxin [Candidatus Culexmicrobium profundum]